MIIRPARPEDAPAMADLQNRIIRIGGTTAYQAERSVDAVRGYIDGPDAICCVIAEAEGRLIGFQALGRSGDLPQGWGDIGTFVDPDVQARGTGAALFAATRAAANSAGVQVINATIRADNVPGLAFYARQGFRDYRHEPDYALQDGRRVGRVHRRLDL
ncbi:GNAT family N-acetyltransferase [Paragemmobacter ruber]|uniref:GNAT family N-acetyltransferase n=1 Tax=Paragemmobacter ruber TaxID=1985673 RepID=A0ABW9Y9G2_9RHOB|nr:GNAT family protein [Rhodobacter ruber]NBE09175.1 GNAT family N-acetyltransferase [Rhodobacter ruber]